MMAIGVIVALVFVIATLRFVLVTPPERLATYLRTAGPIVLMVGGGGLTLAGRGAIGIPLFGLGLAVWRRRRPVGPIGQAGSPSQSQSQVRSRFLAMNLDHDTGELDGDVISGRFEGRALASLADADLRALHAEIGSDRESLRLLEAYLDRRLPGWRDDAQAREGDGLGSAPGSGSMTEEQAYEILGLEPGATAAEIGEAHRRLMKRVHPDHGGSHFLAARINEAKAVLIARHR